MFRILGPRLCTRQGSFYEITYEVLHVVFLPIFNGRVIGSVIVLLWLCFFVSVQKFCSKLGGHFGSYLGHFMFNKI